MAHALERMDGGTDNFFSHLSSFFTFTDEHRDRSHDSIPPLQNGEATVNGVVLPPRVVEELRRLGIALSWYNAGELEDAVEACAHDGQLIDDHSGITFRDQLRLQDHEIEHHDSDNERAAHRGKHHLTVDVHNTVHPELSFRERIRRERERKREETCSSCEESTPSAAF